MKIFEQENFSDSTPPGIYLVHTVGGNACTRGCALIKAYCPARRPDIWACPLAFRGEGVACIQERAAAPAMRRTTRAAAYVTPLHHPCYTTIHRCADAGPTPRVGHKAQAGYRYTARQTTVTHDYMSSVTPRRPDYRYTCTAPRRPCNIRGLSFKTLHETQVSQFLFRRRFVESAVFCYTNWGETEIARKLGQHLWGRVHVHRCMCITISLAPPPLPSNPTILLILLLLIEDS